MKLLVIGGSYFFGRVFVMQASKEHDITVVNRGTWSMESFGVKQIKGDRRDPALWRSCSENYDAVIDFCGYEPGDISCVLENFAGTIRQYIFISTVDVYERGIKGLKDENTPFEMRKFPGEAGQYITGKVALEQEVKEMCNARDIPYTVLRPAVLYGPYNYAPRESVFIQLAVQQRILLQIVDATGRFQFVYVKDAAEAVRRCIGNKETYGQSYNLCNEQIIDYNIFAEAIGKAAETELQLYPVKAAQAAEQGLPIPFPVTAEESELYSAAKSMYDLQIEYTDFFDGMEKTYQAFKGVYA